MKKRNRGKRNGQQPAHTKWKRILTKQQDKDKDINGEKEEMINNYVQECANNKANRRRKQASHKKDRGIPRWFSRVKMVGKARW